MAVSLERHFLGWDRPLCETVPVWLLGGRDGGAVDLLDTVVVVPTRQSIWRLRSALPLAADARGRPLLGPEMVTAAALLHPPVSSRTAGPLRTILAWCDVFGSVPSGTHDAFLGRARFAPAGASLSLARRLAGLRAELADGALTIADVAALGPALEESERWAAMADLERRYLARLESWGLRDAVAGQLAHAREGGIPPGVRRVVVAAVPDPPQLLITLLNRWLERGAGRADILIAAPPNEADAFDEWGRPVPHVWGGRDIALAERDLVLCADPEDQASRVGALLREAMSGMSEPRPHVAIGAPDAETIAPLQRVLAEIGLAAFDPRNRRFADTPLFGLVDALLAWHQRAGYAETARLLRHPDVLAGFAEPAALLAELDETQGERLPVTFAALRAASADRQSRRLSAALARMEDWRKTLSDGSLAAGLRTTLADVYGRRRLESDNPRDLAFREAVGALDEALRELAAAEEAGHSGPVAAAALVARLRDATVKPARADEPVDIEGWLELAWNPAPVLVVAGMNEGFVPDGHVGDVFLPDSLRRQLDLRDDRRRVARDAYTLTTLLAQRRGNGGRVLLLPGKTSLAGDPLRPSRLLFRCSDDRLVERARRLFAELPPARDAAPFGVSFTLDPARVPDAGAGHRSLLQRGLSATKFRDYLACPFRFHLRHVLGMKALDDLAREPDAGAFGTLVHDALNAMGQSDIWSCGDAGRLADWLEAELRRLASRRYGNRPWLGVSVAVESAVRRVRAFAPRQVEWHADGWDIVATECADHRIELGGVIVTGQIDRVDRRRGDGRICVLDYKTADAGKRLDRTHLATAGADDGFPESIVPKALVPNARKDQRWTDLQLPLYRELVRGAHGPDAAIGYVLLPASLAETRFECWADYSPALHDRALACATAVAQRIRDALFWPPASRVAFDDFEGLLFDDAQRFVAPAGPGGGVGEGVS